MVYPPPVNRSRSTIAKSQGNYFDMIYTDLNIYYWNVENPTHTYVDLSEEVYTENHPGYTKPPPLADVGGPFYLERFRQSIVGRGGDTIHRILDANPPGLYWDTSYVGEIWPISPSEMEYPTPQSSSENQMNMWGAECVAKAAPGESPMNLVTMLGELKKDGIPSIVGHTFKQRTNVAKKAGDEYLNAQFGWKPLVSDVKSLAKTVTSSDEILNQLERDSGQVVRRRLTLREEDDTYTQDLGIHTPVLGGGLTSEFFSHKYPHGRVTKTVRTRRKVWFSGSFTYYLPPSYYARDRIAGAAAQANKLLGLELKPSVLWNLAPWSWAADWFSNADEVISNCERLLSNELVMHYGYLMEHTLCEATYSTEVPGVLPVTLSTETKSRVKANPFGFGVDFEGLDDFQTSILVALGMSRSGKLHITPNNEVTPRRSDAICHFKILLYSRLRPHKRWSMQMQLLV